MKELLIDVQRRLKMSDKEFELYLPDVEHTTCILKEEKIEFIPDFKLVFFSHMVSLSKRLKDKIDLDCGDDYPEDEVDKNAIKVSERIIIPLSKKYNCNLNKMEIILAGIQIQLAMEMQQENKN